MTAVDAAKASQQFREDAKTLRKAHKQGKKQVMVRGIEMTITVLKKTRKIAMGGKLNKDYPPVELTLTEKWLLAKPADGAMLPIYCVEPDGHSNGFVGSMKKQNGKR
jgi:hypothetical protein